MVFQFAHVVEGVRFPRPDAQGKLGRGFMEHELPTVVMRPARGLGATARGAYSHVGKGASAARSSSSVPLAERQRRESEQSIGYWVRLLPTRTR